MAIPSSGTARRRPTAPAAPTPRARPRLARGESLEDAARGAAEIATEAVRNGLPTSAQDRARSTSSILRLSELGEFGLLAELERGLVRGQDAEAVPADGVVVTQDTLVEGVHFRAEWIPWRDLGYKAAAVNLSDLAALGADPEALLVSLALPPETASEAIVELYEGLAEPASGWRRHDPSRRHVHGDGGRPQRARSRTRGRRSRRRARGHGAARRGGRRPPRPA